MGYATTGQTIEAVLPILHGAGGNGKTVFLQTIADTLGPELSGPVEAELLLENRFHKPSGGPSSDLIHLRGRRLTWLSETNENRRLNAGKAKLLTGADYITGRAPHAVRQITFKPTHKIFLLTNHRPKADAHDAALWRRVLLIPFELSFVVNPQKPNERKADLNLAEKLRNERPGILAWLVKGCLEWQQQGLNPPESVLAATADYRNSEDTVKIFLAERCIEDKTSHVRAGVLYAAYKAWAEASGERQLTGKKFWHYVDECFDSDKDRGGKFYIGLGLNVTDVMD
jgi:putative DNA primase/helicase